MLCTAQDHGCCALHRIMDVVHRVMDVVHSAAAQKGERLGRKKGTTINSVGIPHAHSRKWRMWTELLSACLHGAHFQILLSRSVNMCVRVCCMCVCCMCCVWVFVVCVCVVCVCACVLCVNCKQKAHNLIVLHK